MERTSTLSTPEVVGIATAAAAALGGVVVALGRSQAAAARSRVEHVAASAPRPSVAADRGRELAKLAASIITTRYPELRQEAEAIIQRAPLTRPSASRVRDSATERAEHVRATGTQAIGRVQETVVPAAASALHSLRTRAIDALHQAQPATSVAVTRTAEKADVALAKSSSAARETVATIGWLVAASALVYIVLLSPERRQQVRTFAVTAYEQIRLLVQDFQGYDEEY